jgi:hypothetical protein
MWKHGTSLVLLILVGLSSPASAQAQCPELTRLRAEAAAAAKPTRGAPALGRCESYIRTSIAWNDVAKYASDHREACDVSPSMLDTIEKAHRDAVKARDNICTGRPILPYRADIILH